MGYDRPLRHIKSNDEYAGIGDHRLHQGDADFLLLRGRVCDCNGNCSLRDFRPLDSVPARNSFLMTKFIAKFDQRQLVVNWHITQACNYRCQYCYAQWEGASCEPDLICSADHTRNLLLQLFEFFKPGNDENPLRREMQWNSVRLNFAGGEPLLNQQRTLDAINLAKHVGFDVSLITNGSRLDSDMLAALAPGLSMIGISIDSCDEGTNRGIGRMDRHGRALGFESLSHGLRTARIANPRLRLKVNTVVNALNSQEDMNFMIQGLAPNKWKVLKMLPVINNNLEVTHSQFEGFVTRHRELESIMTAEDDESLTESYIMVDPKGRFFQNSPGDGPMGYHYSRPILQAGAQEAFSDLTFNARKFLSRYSRPSPIAAEMCQV